MTKKTAAKKASPKKKTAAAAKKAAAKPKAAAKKAAAKPKETKKEVKKAAPKVKEKAEKVTKAAVKKVSPKKVVSKESQESAGQVAGKVVSNTIDGASKLATNALDALSSPFKSNSGNARGKVSWLGLSSHFPFRPVYGFREASYWNCCLFWCESVDEQLADILVF